MLTLRMVADVLTLPSIEYGLIEDDADITSAGEVIQWMYLDSHHMAIKEQMRVDSINAVPIHVANVQTIACDYDDSRFGNTWSDLGVGNGHHRLMMAVELGFKYILTSDDVNETGGDDDPVITLGEVDLAEIGFR